MSNCTENRPWGSFTVLDESDGFKVKRISVNPGHKLSLQYHHHRSEHWTVVQGVATVTVGEDIKKVEVNESVYIPLKEKHALANEGEELMQLIEVQVGDYLGEDDIVRLEDRYGRA
jgi:mannose-6-phosphate isomerase-like protein (cupin superfamily)|tara:strand:- start:70 stop:417 length:348 start_codon:yes stop_codon:yes gene_type:complete